MSVVRHFIFRRRWVAAGILLVALAAAGSFALAQMRYAAAPVRITIDATPITAFDNRDPSLTRFGLLEFRGGLALTSKHEAFGGISGIHVEPDGSRFIAITDRGSWLRGRILYRDGKPSGIADAELAPILGPDGKPLAATGWYDAESLAEHGGMLYVGYERVHRIVRFNYARDGLRARGEPLPQPADFKTLVSNKSLECLAAPPKGSLHAGELIAVSERSLDDAGNIRAFVVGKDGGVTRFAVTRSGDFDISGCAIMPPGDLLLLERSFTPIRGVGLRIRRVPLTALKPGAVVDGTPLIEADLAYQIDNMEGIDVHRGARGETTITLVSDDNFSVIQRNLLLQFVLAE